MAKSWPCTSPEVRGASARQFWAWQAQAAVMEAVMEAVRALAGALAARGTNEATALKQ